MSEIVNPQITAAAPKPPVAAAQATQVPVTTNTSGAQGVTTTPATVTANTVSAGTTVNVTPQQLAAPVNQTGLFDPPDYSSAKVALAGAVDKAPQIVRDTLNKTGVELRDISEEQFHAVAKFILEQIFASENSRKALEPILNKGLSLVYKSMKTIQSFAGIGDKLKDIPFIGALFSSLTAKNETNAPANVPVVVKAEAANTVTSSTSAAPTTAQNVTVGADAKTEVKAAETQTTNSSGGLFQGFMNLIGLGKKPEPAAATPAPSLATA